MIYFLEYFEKEAKNLFLIIALTLWALFATYFALVNKKEILLLMSDSYGTKLISESENVPVEVENFFHNFVGLFYTYNTENYENHINRAVKLMKLSVVKEYNDRINKMYDKLQVVKTNQFSFIHNIKKTRENTYEILMNVERREGEQLWQKDHSLELVVLRSKRTKDNPYGLKVTKLRELN